MKIEILRLGIIGIGNMGSPHLKSITAGNVPGITITVVADTDSSYNSEKVK